MLNQLMDPSVVLVERVKLLGDALALPLALIRKGAIVHCHPEDAAETFCALADNLSDQSPDAPYRLDSDTGCLSVPLGVDSWACLRLPAEAKDHFGEDRLSALSELLGLVMGDSERPVEGLRWAYARNVESNALREFSHPPYLLEEQLSRAVARGDVSGALSTLRQINALQRATVARDPLRSLKNSVIGTCALLSRAAIQGGVAPSQAFTMADAAIQTLEELRNLPDIVALEYDLAVQFAGRVAETAHAGINQAVRLAARFIGDNLGKKLTVASVAAQVYMHPDHLSKLFKEDLGLPLAAFIRQRRVQEAARLLSDSAMPLNDIAHALGFSSSSHLIRLFTRQMGTSPGEFRRRGQQKDEK